MSSTGCERPRDDGPDRGGPDEPARRDGARTWRRRWVRAWRGTNGYARDGLLALASSGRTVGDRYPLRSPDLAALLVEDTCWQLAALDWYSRRPLPGPTRRQRAARGRWRAEGRLLEDQRRRLVDRESQVRAAARAH